MYLLAQENINVSLEVRRIVVDSVQTEAIVLRVALGEGSPLDTFRTKLHTYDHSHGHASRARRYLKILSLLPTLVLPPPRYTAFKQKLASSFVYTRRREEVLPLHQPNHVDRTGNWGA